MSNIPRFCGFMVLSGLLIAQSWVIGQEPPPSPGAGGGMEITKKSLGAEPTKAASRINQVTVYPDSALVGRLVTIPGGRGQFELLITSLPANTAPTSLYCEASEGVRVLATRFRTRQVEKDTREQVRKLDEERRLLVLEKDRLTASLETLDGEKAFLVKLEGFASASTTHATEKGKLDSEQIIALAKYLSENRKANAEFKMSNREKMAGLDEKLAFLQRKAAEVGKGSVRTENDAILVVEKNREEGGTVQLNYLVSNANWRPLYRLRSGKKANDPVGMEYLASLTQETGEDWSGVKLTLSNAQPMLNATPPDLKTLALSIVPRLPTSPVGSRLPLPNGQAQQQGQALFGNIAPGGNVGNQAIPNPDGLANSLDLSNTSKALRSAGQKEYNRRQEGVANDIFNYAGAIDQARDLTLSMDEKKDSVGQGVNAADPQGPSLAYPLKGEFTIATRPDEQILEILRVELPGEHYFKAVPVLNSHVYRQANLVNRSGNIFLPGEATMYHNGEFVGRMNIPLVAAGERFIVGFGVEPQLQVSRKLLEKSKSVQGGNQILKYQYQFLVNSYRGEPAKLQVWDRLPSAEGEAVTSILGLVTPALSIDAMYLREERSRNLLRWDLEVAPETFAEKATTIKYDFKLELDKQMAIGTFFTK